MRFWLIDAIEQFTPGERLEAVKNVSYSEEYLKDHFPEFPVLPGVFMLEAATQASAWLLRLTDNYRHTIISLKEAKNVKYGGFVSPGHQLRISTEVIKQEERLVTFKVSGTVDERVSLSGRIVLERFCLADDDPDLEEYDDRLRTSLRKWSNAIVKPEMRTALSFS
jgi:3-hydroxyacyl-[acyl-carrier-protein] dehydratase